MSKVLILGDIHGRDFWKEPCESWKEDIIFLGDYHDPYGHSVGEPDAEESLVNLKELVEFAGKTSNNIHFLLGNHKF